MNPVVMVVDDSVATRKFIMLALRAQGCRVIVARDGMEALEKLAYEKVDLVITDLNMPNLDGFELVKTLRDHQSYRELPVIILSPLSSDAEIEKGKQLGANAYLVKPFDRKRIQYEVAKFLN